MSSKDEIGNFIKSRLAHYGLLTQVEASNICEKAQAVIGERGRVISFKNGTIRVLVEGPAQAHLLRLQQKQIASQINRELGEEKVEGVRFVIKGS